MRRQSFYRNISTSTDPMSSESPGKRTDKTPTGFKIPVRKRSAVLRDFEKVSGPLRGQNRDQKPKA
jgi:hypothetical protein